MTTKELLNRQFALGFSKLNNVSLKDMVFEFDSVKKMYLKDTLNLIDLTEEEDRE